MIDLTDYSANEFEEFVLLICKEILGIGCSHYRIGKDGGVDSAFVGKANCFPSESKPWEGNIIVQAKHTIFKGQYINSNEFLENKTSIINKEIPKIKKLISEGKLDYYMLFTNRHVTRQGQERVQDTISRAGIPKSNIAIIGLEDLLDYMKLYPRTKHAFSQLSIESVFSRIDHKCLVSIIENIENVLNVETKNNDIIESSLNELKRVEFAKKNEYNKLSAQKQKEIQKDGPINHYYIQEFLSQNNDIRLRYNELVRYIRDNIIVNKELDFDAVLLTLHNKLISENQYLRDNRRSLRYVLNAMYWGCDIGEIE